MEQDDPWAIIPATPYRSAQTRKRWRRGPLAVAGLAVLGAMMIAVLLAGGTQLYRLGYDLVANPHPAATLHPAAAHHQALPDAITTPPSPAPTPAATRAHHRHRHHHHSQPVAEVQLFIPPPPAPVPVITSTPSPPRSPRPTPSSPRPPSPTPTPTTPEPTPTPTFSSRSLEPNSPGLPSFRGQ
jgi:hypothetical protein